MWEPWHGLQEQPCLPGGHFHTVLTTQDHHLAGDTGVKTRMGGSAVDEGTPAQDCVVMTALAPV